jgi:hypothetical protein
MRTCHVYLYYHNNTQEMWSWAKAQCHLFSALPLKILHWSCIPWQIACIEIWSASKNGKVSLPTYSLAKCQYVHDETGETLRCLAKCGYTMALCPRWFRVKGDTKRQSALRLCMVPIGWSTKYIREANKIHWEPLLLVGKMPILTYWLAKCHCCQRRILKSDRWDSGDTCWAKCPCKHASN